MVGLSVVTYTSMALLIMWMVIWSMYLVDITLTDLPPLAALEEILFLVCAGLLWSPMVAVIVFGAVEGLASALYESGLPRYKVMADWILRWRSAFKWVDGNPKFQTQGEPQYES